MRIPRWLNYYFVCISLVLASVNIATASTDEMDIHILQPHEYRSWRNKDGTYTLLEYIGTENKSIRIPDNISEIGDHAFEYCQSIKNVSVPDNVKVIGEWAFHGCRNLESVDIGSGVKKVGNFAFAACWGLRRFTMKGELTEFGRTVFGGDEDLENIAFPLKTKGITEDTFTGCTELSCILGAPGSEIERIAQSMGIEFKANEALRVHVRGYDSDRCEYNYIYMGMWGRREDDIEDIKWRILYVDDEKALLLSEEIIEVRSYGETNEWEDSSLCNWLNGNFVDWAFTKRESEAICSIGEDGKRVFLLTTEELTNPLYGFSADKKMQDKNRCAVGSTIAMEDDLYVNKENGFATYYVATKHGKNYVDMVCSDGSIGYASPDRENVGVRPAIWIDMKKVQLFEGDGTFENPVYWHCDRNRYYFRHWRL